MKRFMLFMAVVGVLASCGTYEKSWPRTLSKQNAEIQGTLQLGTIDVDKPGGSYSIEREITAILPLLFWEMGYVFEPATGGADYIVDVYARERDIQHGWKTKKSISLEVVLWPVQSVRYAGDESVRTPYAAGRTVIAGTAGLSVSGHLENLLRKTAKQC